MSVTLVFKPRHLTKPVLNMRPKFQESVVTDRKFVQINARQEFSRQNFSRQNALRQNISRQSFPAKIFPAKIFSRQNASRQNIPRQNIYLQFSLIKINTFLLYLW